MAYEDETCLEESRELVRKRLIEVQRNRESYIDRYEEKMNKKEVVGRLNDPEDSLNKIMDRIQILGKNQLK